MDMDNALERRKSKLKVNNGFGWCPRRQEKEEEGNELFSRSYLSDVGRRKMKSKGMNKSG
ncbi:hypothetical protein [Alteribacillus iranensis]|uniref:hypothetical protein n=1 Tax=Alteribacillus iranensis TaxID=930128 RepID=UPI000B87EB2A|nr:hypothetical protein [Alteribacillus iranensis]